MAFGCVVGNYVPSCYIVVFESAMVRKGEQEMVREILDAKGIWKLMELNAFSIVNKGALRLAKGEHFVTVKKGAAADLLFEIDFEKQFLFSPIQQRKVALRTREHQSRPISRIFTLIVSHIEA